MRKSLPLAWVALVLSISTASAQRCDGIVVDIAAHNQRCLKAGGGQPFKDCSVCPEMVVVPAGTFTMGAPVEEQVATEREDQVRVTIAKPFALGRFAVTRAEFAAFIDATSHGTDGRCHDLVRGDANQKADRDWRQPGFPQHDRHPVVCVSWHDANAYAEWLTKTTGKAYRLPTEAEREYATRAGTTTPFWWGASISTAEANYNGNVTYGSGTKGEWRKATVPVDAFAANPWGLYNVHGNVWEWAEDCWNGKNAGNPGDGLARVIGDCSLRVLRGASWNNYPHTLRSARRGMEPPGNRLTSIGFRVVRALRPR